MIDRKTIIETISLLKITYPSALKDLGEADLKLMIDVWLNDFKDVSKNEFTKAIQDIRYKNKFFPSVADIKEQLAKNKITSIPDAEDEWQEVLKLVSRYGSYRQQEALKSLKPYTAKIVQYVGYQNICMATPDEQVWNKKEFIADYNNLKNELIINLQLDNSNIKLLESKGE